MHTSYEFYYACHATSPFQSPTLPYFRRQPECPQAQVGYELPFFDAAYVVGTLKRFHCTVSDCQKCRARESPGQPTPLFVPTRCEHCRETWRIQFSRLTSQEKAMLEQEWKARQPDINDHQLLHLTVDVITTIRLTLALPLLRIETDMAEVWFFDHSNYWPAGEQADISRDLPQRSIFRLPFIGSSKKALADGEEARLARWAKFRARRKGFAGFFENLSPDDLRKDILQHSATLLSGRFVTVGKYTKYIDQEIANRRIASSAAKPLPAPSPSQGAAELQGKRDMSNTADRTVRSAMKPKKQEFQVRR